MSPPPARWSLPLHDPWGLLGRVSAGEGLQRPQLTSGSALALTLGQTKRGDQPLEFRALNKFMHNVLHTVHFQ